MVFRIQWACLGREKNLRSENGENCEEVVDIRPTVLKYQKPKPDPPIDSVKVQLTIS